MNILKRVGVFAVCMYLCVSLTSCAYFRHDKSKQTETAIAEATDVTPKTEQDYENELRGLVRGYMESVNKEDDTQHAKILRRKPYYFREYSIYTDPSADFKIVLQKKDKKSTPYIADVTLEKQRFATRLHRKRVEAQQDANMLRDTGTETLTYEWRNGHWVRTGSLFVADTSEENINGEWVPVKETAKRTIASEEEKAQGWLKRFWSSLTGR